MKTREKKVSIISAIIVLFLCILCLFPVKIFAEETKVYGDFEYQYNEEYAGIEIINYLGEDKIVKIPDTIEDIPVMVIGEKAFKNNEEYDRHAVDYEPEYTGNETIQQVIFPSTLKLIKERAFKECPKLKKVVLPEGLQELGEAAFASCYKLKSVKLPESLTAIPESAFSCCTSLEKINIPENVTYIGLEAFTLNSKLTNITFPKNSKLEVIDQGAFSQSGLTEIKLPDSLKVLEGGAFEYCTKLKKVDFGKKSQIKAIEDYTFYYCRSLTKITIPKSVKKVGKHAFESCEKLKKITFKGATPEFQKSAFKKIHKNATFKVPAKYKASYKKKLKKKSWYKSTMSVK